jgi:hypothetical protein
VTAWFGMLGRPLSDGECRHVREYLRGLGIEDVTRVEQVQTWDDARSVITDAAWDRRWWDAEQLEKQRVYARAVAACGESEVLRLLSETLERSSTENGPADDAAARLDCNDAGLLAAAWGAANEALYLGELAGLAGEASAHPFRSKQALFAAGRWPLGILDGRYRLF